MNQSPKEIIERLTIGNQRYIDGQSIHPRQSESRRMELLDKGQNPRAVILGCADSRVPPEVIFDQGLGDLFVIRVAGNVLDDVIISSVEYAVVHLQTQLVVVLGHATCGAITAVVNDQLEGHQFALKEAIMPAIEYSREFPGDRVDNAIRLHARLVAHSLEKSQPILNECVNQGKVIVQPAYYDLESGLVEFLPVL